MEDRQSWKVELSFAVKVYGELCVMTTGTITMHRLCVGNLARVTLTSVSDRNRVLLNVFSQQG